MPNYIAKELKVTYYLFHVLAAILYIVIALMCISDGLFLELIIGTILPIVIVMVINVAVKMAMSKRK